VGEKNKKGMTRMIKRMRIVKREEKENERIL
jgi:hypothetical protein